ncbi:MAG: DUF4168 domain-containing protein [Bacteroidales bacterium]|nr:DUF4168 domain-containing protein [Bacteroidales bacterium]
MNLKKTTAIFTVLLMAVFTFNLTAQTVTPSQKQGDDKISDADLKKYTKVSDGLSEMQQNSRAEMEAIVKDNGMELNRFSEISRAKQSGNEIEMTGEEEKNYNTISRKIQEYNQKNQQKAMQILKKHSLSQQKFMQIRQQLRSDKELQTRLKNIQEQ